jgi:hypothetical protein
VVRKELVNFITSSLPNGLSDHDAQMLEIYINKLNCKKSNHEIKFIRNIDEYSIMELKSKLSEELWQDIFDNTNKDVNNIFNYFLNIYEYLQNFYSCFPKIKVFERQSTNQWITKGIIHSCKRKKDLCLLVRSNNDEKLRNYYSKYSKILRKIMKTANC